MQRIASAAQSLPNQEPPIEQAGFSEMMKEAISGVNSEQLKSSELKSSFERGEDVELSEVMLQAQKASLAFQAMIQVRNKLSEAYKDITNMPL